MLFDSLITNRIARELAPLCGGRVGRVFLAAEATAVLELPRAQLVISWHPEYARVHLVEGMMPAPGLTAAFVDVLRRYLRGARLSAVEQLGFDRVLQLEFLNAEGLGPEASCILMVEPIGRWANAVLCDPQGLIRDAAHRVPLGVNRYRQLLPGERYYPPPGQDQPRLDSEISNELRHAAAASPEETLRRLLMGGFQGASPMLLRELAARAGLDLDATPAEQPSKWAEALVEIMRQIRAEAIEGAAWLYRPARGKAFAYPMRLVSRSTEMVQSLPTLSEAVGQVAAELSSDQLLRQQQERLRAAVRQALEQVTHRRESREQALQRAAEAEKWREFGEALLGNLWRLDWGAPEVEVPVFSEAGERLVRIPVNPSYSPQDNARLYFQRYKKAQRAAKRIPPLLEADRRLEAYLEEVADETERADQGELGELEAEIRRLGYLRQRKARSVPPALSFHRMTGPEGWPLWYGRTGLQNNRLLRQAHPDDVWLHVREGPGGHVVIRTGGRPEALPEAPLLLAARMAAGLSRQRANQRVEVAYTRVRYVRKPRGTPPGFVLYDHDQTLAVEPLVPGGGAEAEG